jgi:hypothetical protein
VSIVGIQHIEVQATENALWVARAATRSLIGTIERLDRDSGMGGVGYADCSHNRLTSRSPPTSLGVIQYKTALFRHAHLNIFQTFAALRKRQA